VGWEGGEGDDFSLASLSRERLNLAKRLS